MGWYRASIVSLSDPMALGRATLQIPQIFGDAVTNWALPLIFSDPAIFVHQVGDTVWASFEGETQDHPVYLPLVALGTTTTLPEGTEVLLSGSTTPSSTVGAAGDFYINTATWTIYGPKTTGGWGAGVSIVGPPGSTGADGAVGATGATGSTGATGATGAGVATGGSTGQVLTKNSATNFDTIWTTPTAGSGGGPGPFWVAANDTPLAIKNLVTASGGAVCDGTGDQVEINAALSTYKSVVLAQGTYNIAASITPGAGDRLMGHGSQASLLKAATGLTTGIVSISGAVDHVTIRDVGFDGNSIGTVNGIDTNITSSSGFTTGSDAALVFENIVMRNITGIGVSMVGVNNRDAKLSKIHVWNAASHGFYINCPDGSGSHLIAGTCGGNGIFMDTSASNWRISNSKCWFSDGDGFRIAGARNRLDGCEAQDNLWAGFRFIGSLLAGNGLTADSNSWNTGNTLANTHSGIEIGRTEVGGTSGGFDIALTNVMAWDKNESSRGRAQRSGIRVRTGARGLAIVGFSTGDPAATHFNVTAGIEFDTPTDQTHSSNYVHGINHRVAI